MEQFEGQEILNFIKELPNDDAFICVKCGHIG